MCLETSKGSKIATKNMVVFKIGELRVPLFGKFVSMWTKYKYKRYVKQRDVDVKRIYNTVDEGYHSFKGFHLQVFIIPKGSKYYCGSHNNVRDGYASSSIIWVGSSFNPITWLAVLLIKLK